jgi:hypothetical protein
MRRILYRDLEMPLVDIYAKTTSGFKSLPGNKLSYIVMDYMLESQTHTCMRGVIHVFN